VQLLEHAPQNIFLTMDLLLKTGSLGTASLDVGLANCLFHQDRQTRPLFLIENYSET